MRLSFEPRLQAVRLVTARMSLVEGHGGGARPGCASPASRPHRSPHRLTTEAGAAVADLATDDGCRPGRARRSVGWQFPHTAADNHSCPISAEPNRPSMRSCPAPRCALAREDGIEVEQVMRQQGRLCQPPPAGELRRTRPAVPAPAARPLTAPRCALSKSRSERDYSSFASAIGRECTGWPSLSYRKTALARGYIS